MPQALWLDFSKFRLFIGDCQFFRPKEKSDFGYFLKLSKNAFYVAKTFNVLVRKLSCFSSQPFKYPND